MKNKNQKAQWMKWYPILNKLSVPEQDQAIQTCMRQMMIIAGILLVLLVGYLFIGMWTSEAAVLSVADWVNYKYSLVQQTRGAGRFIRFIIEFWPVVVIVFAGIFFGAKGRDILMNHYLKKHHPDLQ